MLEEQCRQLHLKLWKIADDLRGKMNADHDQKKNDGAQRRHSFFVLKGAAT